MFSKVKAKFQEFDQDRWGVYVFFSAIHYLPRCPRSTGQTSTQPLRDVNTNPYDAQGQVQRAAVTQPSYFDPNYHSSLSTPLVAQQSSPAPAPVLKGYDLSPSHSISKWYTLWYLNGLRFIYWLTAPPDTPEILPASPPASSPLPRSSIEAGEQRILTYYT